MKIFFYFFITIAFLVLLTSCEFLKSSSHIDPDDPAIEYIGRFDFSNPKKVRFDWSGVQIRTRFEGTSCSIKLKDGNNDYNVFIDGKLNTVLRTTADTIYVLANGLPNKIHTLLIVKRTEALFGIAAFEGFILDGGKELVGSYNLIKKKIELVGDSYFTGFGSEGSSPDCVFSRETENSSLSFGTQLARRLDADYSIVAISGVGVVKNYGDSLRTSEFPLPYYYDRSCMNDTVMWNFERWQADVVLVRLGRNDYSQRPYPTRETFRTAYMKFLKDIRRHYPKAHIFALCGPIRKDPQCDYINSVVNELKGKNGDKKIHFVKLDVKLDPMKDFGCEKHPNLYGNQKIADFLEPLIRKEMKWESIVRRIFPSKPPVK